MDNLIALVSSVSSLDIPLDGILAASQILFAALLFGFVGYHLDQVKKASLKAEKIVAKDRPYDK